MNPRLPVKVTRRASQEIREVSRWWKHHREKAPMAVKEELRRAFEILGRQPLIGSPALNEKLPGVRRLHLSRIRYYLYYRLTANETTVEVLALWHTSRGSGPNL